MKKSTMLFPVYDLQTTMKITDQSHQANMASPPEVDLASRISFTGVSLPESDCKSHFDLQTTGEFEFVNAISPLRKKNEFMQNTAELVGSGGKDTEIVSSEPDQRKPSSRNVSWHNLAKMGTDDSLSIVDLELERSSNTITGIQLRRTQWDQHIASLEFGRRDTDGVELFEPELKDFLAVLSVLAERYALHDTCTCNKLPGRNEIEQRLPSPLYAAETLRAFRNARELAAGILILRDVPAFGAYLATEHSPIVVQVNSGGHVEDTVSAIFIREAELHAINALAEMVDLVWTAARTGSLVNEFAKSNSPSRWIAAATEAAGTRQQRATVSLRRSVAEYAVVAEGLEESATRQVTPDEYVCALRAARASGLIE